MIVEGTFGTFDGGKLVSNLMLFARLLRYAGFPIGPGKVIDAVDSVREIGIVNRHDFYWTLHAVFVDRVSQRELFEQAFEVFWRAPRVGGHAINPDLGESSRELSRRLSDALYADKRIQTKFALPPARLERDGVLTYSEQEVLRTRDFEAMSAEEMVRAKAVIKSMRLLLVPVSSRRYRTHSRGRLVDMRASLRASLRSGGSTIYLVRRRNRERPPPLVVLCDVSGSMSRYSRMLLHFVHTLSSDRNRVFGFVFGTRLTNVTRCLREKDVDVALSKVADAVEDWGGGTRIGICLREFNRSWSRRVLAQGAVVLLITDGLDRDAGAGLAQEVERLHKSSRRVIWLNPLLRYDGFEPKSLGMKAILPHVDDFRPAHNLESLADLTSVLRRPAEGTTQWLTAVTQ